MKNKLIQVISFLLLFTSISSSSYIYTGCSSSSYLNSANLACVNCLANQKANSYQTIATSCQCSAGYLQTTNNGACTAVFDTTCSSANSYFPIYSTDGTTSTNTNNNCAACAGTAKSNNNFTYCIPCGTGMIYDSTQGCICSNISLIKTELGCFSSTISPSVTTSNYAEQLKYLISACSTDSDYLSCSQIVNLCTYSQASTSTPECQFFTTYSLTSYLNIQTQDYLIATSQSTALPIKLVSFSATGNYLSESKLVLGDLMRCGTPSVGDLGVIYGTNIQVECTYDFNNLITEIYSKQYQNKLYQLLIQANDNSYYQIPVYMSGSSSPIKRFFLQDSYTFTNKINILTSLTLQFTFSGGSLKNPKLTPKYTLLSTEIGTGIVGASSKVLSYNVYFSCDLSSFWTGAIASFIVVSIAALAHSIAKTYIGHLNRKSILQFFSNFFGIYSLWLFYYLLFMTGYWFIFTKTTSSPFLLMPIDSSSLSTAFYVLVIIMVLMRLVWALKDKSDKLSTQVYLINWEKGELYNSWRDIFIVNSLAQFYSYRTFSLFWMMAVLLVFMTGIGWQKLSAATSSTTESYSTLTPQSRLLLYFLSCSVLLAIGIVFKILRRVLVIFWPIPFQDFVDYCTVTNISFVFIKRRAPHAYYLHAALPDKTDVTYRQINETIRRGLKKNRSISNQLSSVQSLHLYSIYLSKDIQDKHTQLLKKLENQENGQRNFGKESENKKNSKLRQQFIQMKLKPHIQGMACRENDQRTKTFLQSFCNTPPLDLRQEGGRNRSTVFFDDTLELVSEVFPNGNQFEEIHTLIVIFLGWVTLTNSCPIAAFLTYVVDEYIIGGWIGYSCRVNLEEMTRVKRGFMV